MPRGHATDTTRRRLPPLNAARAFEVVARRGSFTAAAQELHVSQSAISRQIANLEAYLGVRLFDRQLRDVKLTPDGECYASAIAGALEQIELATHRLKVSRAPRPLRIRLFPTLAIRWLMPRLGRFHALHPHIDIQIETAMDPAELDRDDVDFTVSFTPATQKRTRSDALFEIELLPVCSRSVLDTPPPIRTPRDLLRHVLLHPLNRGDDWKRWLQGVGVTSPDPPVGLQLGNSSLLYQGAIDGIGVAIAQYRFVQDDLANGRLIAPFPERVRTGEIYYLASIDRGAEASGIAAFRDWVLAEAAA